MKAGIRDEQKSRALQVLRMLIDLDDEVNDKSNVVDVLDRLDSIVEAAREAINTRTI